MTKSSTRFTATFLIRLVAVLSLSLPALLMSSASAVSQVIRDARTDAPAGAPNEPSAAVRTETQTVTIGGKTVTTQVKFPAKPVLNHKNAPAGVQATVSWQPRATQPIATQRRADAATAYFNNSGADEVYLFGGIQNSFATPITNLTTRYNVAANNYTQVAQLPVAVRSHVAFTINQLNKIFVMGGIVSGSGGAQISTDAVQIYDPVSNTWVQSPNGLPRPRGQIAGGVYADSLIYILGGLNYATFLPTTDVQIYNAKTDSWLAVPVASAMPRALRFHAASIIDNKIVVVGGSDGTDGAAFTSPRVYVGTINPSDPTLISWSRSDDYPGGAILYASAAPVRNSRPAVLVCAGSVSGNPQNSAYLFDITNGTWTSLAAMNFPRMQIGSEIASNGTNFVWAWGGTVAQNDAGSATGSNERGTVNTDLPPDVAVETFIAPSTLVAPKTSVATAVIKNNGSTPTAATTATLTVKDQFNATVFTDTKPVPTIPTADRTSIAFAGFSTAALGDYSATIDVAPVDPEERLDDNTKVAGFRVNGDQALGFTQSFPSPANFPQFWQVQNLAGDSDANSWKPDGLEIFTDHSSPRDSHPLIVRRAGTTAANDWLFTPGLALETGRTYRVSFWYIAFNAALNERLEVKLSGNQNAADTLNTLFRRTNITNTSWQQSTSTFTVGANDKYSIGFHCFSTNTNQPPAGLALAIDDVRIEQLANTDLGVEDVSAPPTLTGAGKTTTVRATVQRFGLTGPTGASTITLRVRNSGGTEVFQTTQSATIATGGTTVNFPGITLPAAGVYTATVRVPSDEIIGNDSLSTTITAIDTVSLASPYTETFETAPNPNFPANWTKEDVNGTTTWSVANNPADDRTPGGRRHPEYRAGGAAADDWFFTPGLNLENSTAKSYKLTFYYKIRQFATTSERLEVILKNNVTDAATNNVTIFPATNLTNETYQISSTIFKPTATGLYTVGFHALTTGDNGTIFIDDITLEEVPPNDIGVSAITTTFANVKGGVAIPVNLTLRNFLSTPQSGFDVSFIAGGDPKVTGNFAGTLNGSGTSAFSLPTWTPAAPATVQQRLTRFSAFTELLLDANRANDTLSTGVYVFPSDALLTKDFNDLSNGTNFGAGWAQGVASGGGSPSWSVVTAVTASHFNQDPIPTPHSGTKMVLFNSWDASNNATRRLISPAIDASAINGNLKAEFWMFRNGNSTFQEPDSVIVYVSINNGTTYTRVGGIQRSDFSNSTPRWDFFNFLLPGTSNQSQVRVAFEGRSAFGTDILLDDINVIPTAGIDVAATRFGAFPSLVTPSGTVDIPFVIRNTGAQAVANCPVKLQVGSALTLNGASTKTLTAGQSDTITFTLPLTGLLGTYVLKATTEFLGDEDAGNNAALSGINIRPNINSAKRVLVLSTSGTVGNAGAVSVIQTQLLAAPTSITALDVINAKVNPVSLQTMLNYDVIIVTSNNGFATARRTELGDSLAAFLRARPQTAVILAGGLHRDNFAEQGHSLGGAFESNALSGLQTLVAGSEADKLFTSFAGAQSRTAQGGAGNGKGSGNPSGTPTVASTKPGYTPHSTQGIIYSPDGAAYVSGLLLPFTGPAATEAVPLTATGIADVGYDDGTVLVAHNVIIGFNTSVIDINARIEDPFLSNAETAMNMGMLIKNMINSGVDGPLPVILNGFTANSAADRVSLNWTTVFEHDNKGFELLRADSGSTTRTLIGSHQSDETLLGKGAQGGNYSYIDATVDAGKTYTYTLRETDLAGRTQDLATVTVRVEASAAAPVPTEFALLQNYPNPFNPSTTFRYNLKADSDVRLELFNVLGQRIALVFTAFEKAGSYEKRFDANRLSAGAYFFRLTATPRGEAAFSATRKMVLLK